MNFFSALFDGGKVTAAGEAGWSPGWSWGAKTSAGVSVSPEAAMGLATYFACLRVISEDIACMPARICRPTADKRGMETADDCPANTLISGRANRKHGAHTFKLIMTHWRLGWGNGYAEIVRDGRDNPVELEPIHPNRVTVKLRNDASIFYTVRNADNTTVDIDYEDMFHLRGFGDTLQGYSIARFGAESIGLGLAMQTFASAFYGNGAQPGLMLEHPGVMTPQAARNFVNSIEERHGGPAKAFRVMLLEEGIKASKMDVPQNEAQFIESRQFEVEEICRWFRINPSKVQQWLRPNYANPEWADTDHVKSALMPTVNVWESEVNLKLLSEAERRKEYCCEFDEQASLRGDTVAQSTLIKARFETASMTPNEVRKVYRDNASDEEGADKLYINGAYQALEFVSSGANVANKVLGGAPSNAQGAMDGEDMDKPEDMPTDKMPSDTGDDKESRAGTRMDDNTRIFTALFENEARRLLRKESKAAAAAMKKYAVDRHEFISWMARFYIEHRPQVQSSMAPLVRSLAELHASDAGLGGLSESEIEAAEKTARLYADDHADKSQTYFLHIYDGESADVEAYFQNERATEIGEYLAKETGLFMMLAMAGRSVTNA